MLKKYLEFIKESISEVENLHHSVGEWVEDLCENNKEILELIRPYVEETDPSVRIANSINTLDKNKKRSVYKIVSDYLNGTGKKTDIRAFVDLTKESNLTKEKVDKNELNAGKNVFNSFLKVISSLGMKDTKPNWDNLPDDFLLFFEYKCDYASVHEKIERFPSLNMFADKLPKENCSLYYGIKIDRTFNFGFKSGEKIIKIGSFKINKGTINYLNLIESPSAAHLKRELAYLNTEKIYLLSDVAKYMKLYHPGETEERSFKVIDGVLEFGYKGLGVWTNGYMDDEGKQNLKNGFTEYLKKFKDCSKLSACVKPDEKSWIRLNIKIK